jgi:hypothetical protein
MARGQDVAFINRNSPAKPGSVAGCIKNEMDPGVLARCEKGGEQSLSRFVDKAQDKARDKDCSHA